MQCPIWESCTDLLDRQTTSQRTTYDWHNKTTTMSDRCYSGSQRRPNDRVGQPSPHYRTKVERIGRNGNHWLCRTEFFTDDSMLTMGPPCSCNSSYLTVCDLRS